MTAKEYLSQLGVLDQKIKHKKQELREAKGDRGIHAKKDGRDVYKRQPLGRTRARRVVRIAILLI